MAFSQSIALYSAVPGCGKSTIAEYLDAMYRYETVSFADPIKEVVDTFLQQLGVSPSLIYTYRHQQKNFVIPEVGVSYRHLARTMGTEWGRTCVHPDIWVKATHEYVDGCGCRNRFCIDDLRFPNEYSWAKEHNLRIWKVIRNVDAKPEHASDSALQSSEFHFDAVIINDGSIDDLHRLVDNLVEQQVVA